MNMKKLKLTTEQIEVFKKALHEASNKGAQDATFLANSMYQLIETEGKYIPKIIEKYTEW